MTSDLDFALLRTRLMAARRLGGASKCAWEDAVQRGLLEVLQRSGRLNGRTWEEVNVYALRAASSALYKAHRTRSRQHGREQTWWTLESLDVPRPDDLVAAADLSSRCAELLDELPKELVSILRLCDGEGETVSSAANILQIPLGTAKSRLRRARERFRALCVHRKLKP